MNAGKILLVEDDQLSRLVLTRKLKNAGFEVFVAEDGEKGLHLARIHQPDIIISDWMMPRLDGPELCQHIKSDPQLRYSFFILFSARGNTNDRIDGLGTGADEYLAKPCPDEEMIARLQAGMRLVRLQQELIRLQQELGDKNQILARIAVTDPLTNLYNRRYFLETLEAEITRGERYKHDVAVIMSDIDDFKHINDTYGHTAGDHVLCQVAVLLKETTRSSDLVARYGGEEFLVVLPETDLARAEGVAERIRSTVEQYSFALPESLPQIHLTISLGAAQWQSYRHSSAEDLIHDADEALYRAKRSGKNRVCSAECKLSQVAV